MSDVKNLVDELCKARSYTKEMLSNVDPTDWFRQPHEGVTHIAWQVGHLAVAQHSLALKRMRGEKLADNELISPEFRKLFGKGSTPVPDPAVYPPLEEIHQVLDNVLQTVLAESEDWSPASLADSAGEPPHPMFKTKFEAICWCVQHEYIHAGQIGLLRRLFGASPLR